MSDMVAAAVATNAKYMISNKPLSCTGTFTRHVGAVVSHRRLVARRRRRRRSDEVCLFSLDDDEVEDQGHVERVAIGEHDEQLQQNACCHCTAVSVRGGGTQQQAGR
jgi:hypothetical protein